MTFMEISCKLDLNISDAIYIMIYDILQIENDFKNDNFSLRESTSETNSNINVNKNYCCI